MDITTRFKASVNLDGYADKAEGIRDLYDGRWANGANVTFMIRFLRALALADLPPATKWTAAVMSLFSDWSTGENCFPGQATIAAMTRETERSVRRHTRELEKAGLVSAVTGKGRTTSRYNLAIPEKTLTELATLMDHGQSGRECPPWEDASVRPEGTPMSGLRGQDCPPIISVNQTKESDQTTKKAEQISEAGVLKYTDDFSRDFPVSTDASRSDFSGAAATVGSVLEDFQEMALDAKERDENHILAPVLFTPKSYSELEVIANECGIRFVDQAIDFVLAKSKTDGNVRRGGIRSWNYFTAKANDYRKEERLAIAGVAPGDRMLLRKGCDGYEQKG